jgi:UDP-glucose 4-epimerase
MKVLVTGGSGFIGSHVVDRLLAHGHEPRIFDLVESPYHHPGEVELVIGDLVDQDRLRTALRDCDAVVHLAAVSDVNKVLADPGLAESVNGGGTRTVLEAARLEGVSRIVYASTVWIYGDSNGHGPLDEDEPLSLPGHLYTATKLAGEMYCSSYGALYGMDTTIARFGIPYGPRARPATVLAAFVQRALADEPITIAGDGTQSRRFIYVEDLAEGVVATLDPAAIGRVYNLVGGESTTVREIAETVTRVVCPVPIVHVEGRPGDIQGAEISGARAKRELGWEATTSFDEGVSRYVAWVTDGNGNGNGNGHAHANGHRNGNGNGSA